MMTTPGMTVVEALEAALRRASPQYIDIHEGEHTPDLEENPLVDDYHDLAWGTARYLLADPHFIAALVQTIPEVIPVIDEANYFEAFAARLARRLREQIPAPEWEGQEQP